MRYELRSTEQYNKWFAKLKDQAGGDKTTQTRDIDKAARLLHELEE